jgi:hypothetical protein
MGQTYPSHGATVCQTGVCRKTNGRWRVGHEPASVSMTLAP